MGGYLRLREPSMINQLQQYRPLCSKCGTPCDLIGIEPAPEADHDLRTFECSVCGNTDTVKIKFR